MDPISCIRRATSPHCASAGRLMASILDRTVRNATYREVSDFYNMNGCLEPGTSASTAVGFYDEWALKSNPDKIEALHNIIVKNSDCRPQLCKNLIFPCNADFAGIGVMVSFGIQISIATSFAIYALYRIFKTKTLGTAWVSFRSTFHTFFISSIFFNVAIALSATSAIAIEKRTEHTAVFTTLGFLVSLASTQALWSLFRLYNGTTKEESNTARVPAATSRWTIFFTNTHLIQLCLGLLWIVMLVLCAVIVKVDWNTNFEVFCFHRLKGRPIATGLLYAPMGLAFLVLVNAVLKKVFPGNQNSEWKPWAWVDPTTVFLGLIFMWLAFGVLWMLRTQLGTVAGDTYQDNDWGFGQVAAVAAWLPTVVEMVRDTYHKLQVAKVTEQAKAGGQDAGDVGRVQV